jgi:hypothetical protein
MKMAELLRQLADKLDQIETGKDADVLGKNNAEPSDDDKFIPPLQQKLELLKKGVGVDSEFDDEGDAELDAIKKNAGISPAVIHIASDDEPLE